MVGLLGISAVLLGAMSPRRRTAMTTLRLLLGDQLDPRHSWFARIDPEVVYLLAEMRQETGYVLHHAQKVLAIFAAMRAFASQLRALGHRVEYVRIGESRARLDLPDLLEQVAVSVGADRVAWQLPDEWRLDAQLRSWSECTSLRTEAVDSEHFLTSRSDAARHFGARKRWVMESFYRMMRQRHGVLLTSEGEPEGGRWNFDSENRSAWRGEPPAPEDRRPCHDHGALWQEIVDAGVRTFGDPQQSALRWPVDRSEALHQLDAFLTHALPHFGTYQDAIAVDAPRLFHALISFALNTKMLRPDEVIGAVESAYRNGDVPLACAEGFIRQILGWREYVRGVYWARMPGYTRVNALEHRRPLPEWFWTGDTRMRCVAGAVGQSLSSAYAHHIQRLMLVGNFALLAGLDPEAVHHWYLGIYIDAFEWVEAPNTLGMSQFADGGLLATKPYVSSGAYIQRMGDACSACHYRVRERTGARACPFNALYWHFIDRHGARLRGNPRMAMPYRNWARMDAATRSALLAHAESLLERLDQL